MQLFFAARAARRDAFPAPLHHLFGQDSAPSKEGATQESRGTDGEKAVLSEEAIVFVVTVSQENAHFKRETGLSASNSQKNLFFGQGLGYEFRRAAHSFQNRRVAASTAPVLRPRNETPRPQTRMRRGGRSPPEAPGKARSPTS